MRAWIRIILLAVVAANGGCGSLYTEDETGLPSNGFRMTLTPRVNLAPTTHATVEVVVTRGEIFTDAVTISFEGLPPGITAAGITLAPGETTGTVTFQAEEQAPLTTARVKVVGRSADREVSTSLSVIVQEPFTLTLDPNQLTIPRGQRADTRFRVRRSPGYDRPIELTFPELIPGGTLTLPSGPVVEGTVTVTIGEQAPAATHKFIIVAQSGALQRTAPLTVEVPPPGGLLDRSYGIDGVVSVQATGPGALGFVPMGGDSLILSPVDLVDPVTGLRDPHVLVARRDYLGQASGTFGTDDRGVVELRLAGEELAAIRAGGIVADWDSNIFVAWTATTASEEAGESEALVLQKLSPSGELVQTSVVRSPTVMGGFDVSDLELTETGQVLAVATSADGNVVLVRYTLEGTLDATFGTGGVVRFSVPAPEDGEAPWSSVFAFADGRVRTVTSLRSADLPQHQFLGTGAPDLDFGTGGQRTSTVYFPGVRTGRVRLNHSSASLPGGKFPASYVGDDGLRRAGMFSVREEGGMSWPSGSNTAWLGDQLPEHLAFADGVERWFLVGLSGSSPIVALLEHGVLDVSYGDAGVSTPPVEMQTVDAIRSTGNGLLIFGTGQLIRLRP